MRYYKTLDGKWVEGYPYMTWHLDKQGHHIMPGQKWWRWRLRNSTRSEFEFLVADSPMPETMFATEYREIEGEFIAPTAKIHAEREGRMG